MLLKRKLNQLMKRDKFMRGTSVAGMGMKKVGGKTKGTSKPNMMKGGKKPKGSTKPNVGLYHKSRGAKGM